MKYALWTAQGLLALMFAFAGALKLVLPVAVLTQQIPVPGLFLRFVGAAELLGAAGLIVPGLVRARASLTPAAAAALAVLMAGATGVTLVTAGPAAALVPVGAGLLAAFVACGRWRLAVGRAVAVAAPAPADWVRGRPAAQAQHPA